MMLKLIFKVIKVIQSDDSPKKLAWGVAYGSLLGLVPGFTIYHFILFIGVYLFSINVGMTLLSYVLFKFITVFISRYAHLIGSNLLIENEALQPFWTIMYNLPVIPWTRFYNTVVLGGIVLSVCFFLPNYYISLKLIILYRKHLRDRLRGKMDKWKIVKVLKGSKLVKLYGKYTKVKDAVKFKR